MRMILWIPAMMVLGCQGVNPAVHDPLRTDDPDKVMMGQAAAESASADSFMLRSFDGTYIEVHVRKPEGKGPFPAIHLLHGGLGGRPEGRMEVVANRHLPNFFLEKGYVVMASEYRRYHFGVEEMYDVYAAYEKLESLPFVDRNRISVIGGSHGGYLAELLAMHKKPVCVVSLAGLVDIEALYDRAQDFRKSFSTQEEGWAILTMAKDERAKLKPFLEDAELFKQNPVAKNMILAESVFELALRFEDNKDKYTEISPLQNAEKIQVPLLYISGDLDPLTVNGRKLVEKMQMLGKIAELSIHPGVGHGFSTGYRNPHPEFYKAAEKMLNFIEAHSK